MVDTERTRRRRRRRVGGRPARGRGGNRDKDWGRFERLGDYKQRGGKIVIAWSVEVDVDIDVAAIASNRFALEWPPRSGTMQEFPEVDRAGWFSLAEADGKILEGQKAILSDFAERQARGLIDRLVRRAMSAALTSSDARRAARCCAPSRCAPRSAAMDPIGLVCREPCFAEPSRLTPLAARVPDPARA